MFDIIPKLFYSSYNRQFGHSFETLQIFINYGGEILKNSPQAIRTIIEMSIASLTAVEEKGRRRTEADNCEGVILLHSLMLACGKTFDAEMWLVVATNLHKRLDQPLVKTKHLKAKYFFSFIVVYLQDCRWCWWWDSDFSLMKIMMFFSIKSPRIITALVSNTREKW